MRSAIESVGTTALEVRIGLCWCANAAQSACSYKLRPVDFDLFLPVAFVLSAAQDRNVSGKAGDLRIESLHGDDQPHQGHHHAEAEYRASSLTSLSSRPCLASTTVAELTAIKKAIATGDWAALEVYGGLNPARYSGRAFSALSEPVARSVG